MAFAVGRNDPCPCKSGKKYKKCCLAKDEAALAQAAVAHRLHERSVAAPVIQPKALHPHVTETDIGDLSDATVNAIGARRFDEAERLCDRLLKEFPDQVDGHEQLGQLREAQGRFSEAAKHYTDALAFIDRVKEGFDEGSIAYFRECHARVLSKLKG